MKFLASYPKSGNTWLRCLIGAYLTGEVNPNYLPGPVDQADLKPYQYQAVAPRALARMTPPAVTALRGAVLQNLSCDDRNLIKTHHANISMHGQELFPAWLVSKAVYLIRDPRDIAVSMAAHLGRSLDEVLEMMRNEGTVLNRPDMPALMHFLTSWSRHVDSWMRSEFDTLAVQYEALQDEPVQQLSDILEFLGYEPEWERVERAVEAASLESMSQVEQGEGFREARKGTFFGGDRPELPTELRQRIETDHGPIMQALGYL